MLHAIKNFKIPHLDCYMFTHSFMRLVLGVLRKEYLYVNLKNYNFCTHKLIFLSFVISAKGIEVNEKKVKTIKEWPMPRGVGDV